MGCAAPGQKRAMGEPPDSPERVEAARKSSALKIGPVSRLPSASAGGGSGVGTLKMDPKNPS